MSGTTRTQVTGMLVAMALSALLAGSAAAQGARGSQRWAGERPERPELAMPTPSVIEGPMTPAALMALMPLSLEQQRRYVAVHDSATAAMQVQRDTLRAFIATRPSRSPLDREEAAANAGDPPDPSDETSSANEDTRRPGEPGPIPSAGRVDDPARLARLAFQQQVVRLAAPLGEAQAAFEQLMPEILTKAQYKVYRDWFDAHNHVEKVYPRWHGHQDPDASGARYGR